MNEKNGCSDFVSMVNRKLIQSRIPDEIDYYNSAKNIINSTLLQARSVDRSIIFIDECNTVFSKRGSNEKPFITAIKSQFLLEMESKCNMSE